VLVRPNLAVVSEVHPRMGRGHRRRRVRAAVLGSKPECEGEDREGDGRLIRESADRLAARANGDRGNAGSSRALGFWLVCRRYARVTAGAYTLVGAATVSE
jgi:hypothetical protein